jgi:tetratricopeptide (TPR) repeat protein
MSDDSSSGDGFAGFIESIKKWGLPIVGVIVFIFGLPKVFDAAKGNITWSVLSVAGVSWLLLFWVYTSKVGRLVSPEGQLPKKEKSPQFPKLRRWALAGMVAFPLLTLSGFAIADYIERRLSNKTIILIADFQGPDQKHAVTQMVINRMKLAVSEFPEVQISPLGEVIKEGTQSETVRRIGTEHKASVVVWGFYEESLNGTAHIDQVRQTSSFSLLRNEPDFKVTLPEGRGISVKEALSGDTSLLALLVVGVARYDAGDYDGAIDRFTKALEQQHSSQSESEVVDVKFFLGKSLFQKGKYSEAVGRLQEVVSRRDNDPYVLSWLGSALLYAARYAEAEPLCKRALAITEKALGPEHPDTALSLNNLATLYISQGRYAEAEPLYQRALAIVEKALGPEHPNTAQALENYAALMRKLNRESEAAKLEARAEGIREKTNRK